MAQIWELHNSGFINDCSDLPIHYFVVIIQKAEGWRSEVTYCVLKDPFPSSITSGLRACRLPHMPRSHTRLCGWLLAKWKKGHKVIIWRETTPHHQDLGDARPPFWIQSLPFTITYQLYIRYGVSLGYPCEFNILPNAHNCIRVAACEEWVVPKAVAGASFG